MTGRRLHRGRRPKNPPDPPDLNQKTILQGFMKQLAREYGVRLPKGKIEERVSALAGEELDYLGAYEWLADMYEQRAEELA